MRGANEREINASRNRGSEHTDYQPRSTPQFDIDDGGNEHRENARQTGDRDDARDSIYGNAGSCKQERQHSEVEAVNHSEGQNEQAEDPGRRPSTLSIHV